MDRVEGRFLLSNLKAYFRENDQDIFDQYYKQPVPSSAQQKGGRRGSGGFLQVWL